MRAYLQQVAAGPHLSKPLRRAAARDAMEIILAGQVDAVQAGIYLIALRMKRETEQENLGALDALLSLVEHHGVDVRQLVNIADPFNGYARGVPATPFLAPVLAACGLPAYVHGLRAVGPKYGVTAHQVYAAADVAVDLSSAAAARRLENPHIGWAYLDQARYFPALHQLLPLRAQMVKRTCLTTLEVLLGPLRATSPPRQKNRHPAAGTHLMTGYVHAAYPPVYSLLARRAGYDGAMIVRGVEGGCVPSLSQPAKFFRYMGGAADGSKLDEAVRITPQQVGIAPASAPAARMIPIPTALLREMPAYPGSAEAGIMAPVDTEKTAAHCLQLGASALAGQAGAMRDSLIYAAAICLFHGAGVDWRSAAAQAGAALDSGAALARFTAARG